MMMTKSVIKAIKKLYSDGKCQNIVPSKTNSSVNCGLDSPERVVDSAVQSCADHTDTQLVEAGMNVLGRSWTCVALSHYKQNITGRSHAGQTWPPGTCQVGRLVRRPGGPPHRMFEGAEWRRGPETLSRKGGSPRRGPEFLVTPLLMGPVCLR